ncbi:MAG: ATP-binding protein [Sedimentisphaerales bacterium]
MNCHISDTVENMHGVESSIEEMLTTLLLNAIKYTPENGEITVRLTSELDSVLLQISDTGIGIPAAEQAKIFDEFYRAGKATNVEENSPGLGLVIVKYIVEIHGGKIAVDSQEGRGTTFTITLPCVVS